MIKKFLQLGFLQLSAISLCVVLSVHTVAGAVAFTKESIHRNSGILSEVSLSETDFILQSLVKADGGYVSSDSDPQLIKEIDGMFTGIEMKMKSTMPSGQVLAYYTTGPDMPFSEKNVLWLLNTGGNIYSATVPEKYIHTLRIDPTEFAGNQLEFDGFVINRYKTPADYMSINHTNLPVMAFYIAFLSGILKLIQDFLQKINISSIKK